MLRAMVCVFVSLLMYGPYSYVSADADAARKTKSDLARYARWCENPKNFTPTALIYEARKIQGINRYIDLRMQASYFRYLLDFDSVLETELAVLQAQGIDFNEDLYLDKKGLDNDNARLIKYLNDALIHLEHVAGTNEGIYGRDLNLKDLYTKKANCAMFLGGSDANSEEYKKLKKSLLYAEEVTGPLETPHFEVQLKECQVTDKVDYFAAPKSIPNTRFVTVSAIYKNLDTESQRPELGVLEVNHKGAALKYSPEAILEDGLSIYPNPINPLVTMPLSIVYRIPFEVQGEVQWTLGSDKERVSGWCGFVYAIEQE